MASAAAQNSANGCTSTVCTCCIQGVPDNFRAANMGNPVGPLQWTISGEKSLSALQTISRLRKAGFEKSASGTNTDFAVRLIRSEKWPLPAIRANVSNLFRSRFSAAVHNTSSDPEKAEGLLTKSNLRTVPRVRDELSSRASFRRCLSVFRIRRCLSARRPSPSSNILGLGSCAAISRNKATSRGARRN